MYSSRDMSQPKDIQSLVSFFDSAESPAFASLDLSTLHEIRHTYGSSSNEYIQVADTLRAYLEQILDDNNFNLAIITLPPRSTSSLSKRQDPAPSHTPSPSPQQPIGSISACFTTLDVCNNSTSSCSGRGTCVQASKAGRTCFVCSCGVTKTGEGNKLKTVTWAGQSCERQDVSGYVNFAPYLVLWLNSLWQSICFTFWHRNRDYRPLYRLDILVIRCRWAASTKHPISDCCKSEEGIREPFPSDR